METLQANSAPASRPAWAVVLMLALGASIVGATATPASADSNTTAAPMDDRSDSYSSGSSDLAGMTGLRKAGIDLSLWGWLAYYGSSQSRYRTYWSSELELDVTKTFAKVFAISADVEFIDYDDKPYGNAEQLFASLLLSRDHGIILTGGKFNSPIGLEARDFWDRYTATPSLLFRAQPQDLRGVMLTTPLGSPNLTLRTYVVSGFADEDYIPGWPATGMTAQYRPRPELNFAVTGWIGPGVEWAQSNNYGYGGGGGYANEVAQQYENFSLTDSWHTADFKSAGRAHLFFFNAHALVKPRRDLTLGAEFIYGVTDTYSDLSHWLGLSALVNYDIDDRWRVFGMWSYLDDGDWLVYSEPGQVRNEVAVGIGYRLDSHIEFRGEYRHDFSNLLDDVDTVSIHVSFGY